MTIINFDLIYPDTSKQTVLYQLGRVLLYPNYLMGSEILPKTFCNDTKKNPIGTYPIRSAIVVSKPIFRITNHFTFIATAFPQTTVHVYYLFSLT